MVSPKKANNKNTHIYNVIQFLTRDVVPNRLTIVHIGETELMASCAYIRSLATIMDRDDSDFHFTHLSIMVHDILINFACKRFLRFAVFHIIR